MERKRRMEIGLVAESETRVRRMSVAGNRPAFHKVRGLGEVDYQVG